MITGMTNTSGLTDMNGATRTPRRMPHPTCYRKMLRKPLLRRMIERAYETKLPYFSPVGWTVILGVAFLIGVYIGTV